MSRLDKHKQGFTLIELMIVIAIIAIIISYALPAYRNYSVRTKIVEGAAMSAAYKMAINEAYSRSGSLTGLNNDTNGIGPSAATGYCVSSIGVLDGEITVTFNCASGSSGDADLQVLAAELVFSPNVDPSGTLQWVCSATVNRAEHSPC